MFHVKHFKFIIFKNKNPFSLMHYPPITQHQLNKTQIKSYLLFVLNSIIQTKFNSTIHNKHNLTASIATIKFIHYKI